MHQPEGFQQHSPEWVLQLKKGLYGLKQGGRLWYQRLDEELRKMGFQRVESDRSVYVWEKDGCKVITPVFVDDLTIVSKSRAMVDKVKADLAKVFKLRDLGPTSFLLGVAVTRDRRNRSLQLSQRQYIIDILDRFNMSDCKPVTTPMEPGLHLSSAPSPLPADQAEEMHGVPYMEAVGALMYLSVSTRPDITQAVGVLCRFMANPAPSHWKAVKHLFRYLQGTKDIKLTYSPTSSNEPFLCFSDADLGGNPDNGRSTSGYVVKVGSGAVQC